MKETFDYLNDYYSNYDEESRLSSKHGMVEFLTTIKYIEKYLKPGMRILEVGAGSGKYSHYFAKNGYSVDAVELIPHNIDVFKSNTTAEEDITIRQGNAIDLSFIGNELYDITLLLGPMYHLFTDEDKHAALSEALRVTKSGGYLMVSYCMNDATVINYLFIKHHLNDEKLQPLINPETFKLASNPEELFELWRREEIDSFVEKLPVRRLDFVGTDMYTNYMRETVDNLDDYEYDKYLKYHFYICNRPDMIGISHHTLDVLQKL